MKQKHLLWLGGLLLATLLVAFLAGVFDRDVSTIRVPEVKVAASSVTAIEIRSPESDLSLERTESGWMLMEPAKGRADSTTVSRVLSDLEALELSSVVTRSADRYERFGVDSAGTALTLTANGERRTYVVGNRSSDYTANYFRMEGDERVFLTRKAIDIPKDTGRWRDRTIIKIAPGEVQGAAVNGPEHSYSLSLVENRWNIDGQAADSAAVQRWLGRFNPMMSDGFYDRIAAETDSSYSLVLELSGSRIETLRLEPREEDFQIQRSGGETAFRLRAMRIDQYVPERSYFLAAD